MFVVSKLIGPLLLPSNFIGLAAALGLLCLILRWRRVGRLLLIFTALTLIVFGWLPIGFAALKVLEERFPPPIVSGPIAGIIMLGGAVNTHITAERGQDTLNSAGERITSLAALSRQFPEARLLLSGGANHVLPTQPLTESAIARDLLVDLGVDPTRIETEEFSRDTCENASASQRLLRPQPTEHWLLVTSASNMPRSIACFRAAEFPVIPYPVDFRTQGSTDLRAITPSVADGLQASDLAAHEWLGLLSYRLFGRTSTFFPAP